MSSVHCTPSWVSRPVKTSLTGMPFYKVASNNSIVGFLSRYGWFLRLFQYFPDAKNLASFSLNRLMRPIGIVLLPPL